MAHISGFERDQLLLLPEVQRRKTLLTAAVRCSSLARQSRTGESACQHCGLSSTASDLSAASRDDRAPELATAASMTAETRQPLHLISCRQFGPSAFDSGIRVSIQDGGFGAASRQAHWSHARRRRIKKHRSNRAALPSVLPSLPLRAVKIHRHWEICNDCQHSRTPRRLSNQRQFVHADEPGLRRHRSSRAH